MSPRPQHRVVLFGRCTNTLDGLYQSARGPRPATEPPARVASPVCHPRDDVRVMTTATGRVRAPELHGAGGWINTDIALSLRDLRGRVVILDFLTFSCINCLRVIEELRDLEHRFGVRLLVMGVHSPTFPHETDHTAVVRAVTRHRVVHSGARRPGAGDLLGSRGPALDQLLAGCCWARAQARSSSGGGSGNLTSTVASRSPAASPRRCGIPRPRSRSRAPFCVPGGTES
jgi:thiol-disulfide isomerase/thioredoxin